MILSRAQAQKLILLCQWLPSKGGNSSLDIFEQLGYVQIDTISVVQRAHHHILWSRNSNYHPSQLDNLLAERKIFEYWSHAASYLPMRDYRYSLPRKLAIKTGELHHWFKKDEQLMARILQRIEDEGPLMAKDFESQQKQKHVWGSKPTKQALECLYMQGDLMIRERKKFHKVYDITNRVLPDNIDTRIPSPKEYAHFLIIRYLKANGLGTLAQITYLLKNTKSEVQSRLNELVQQQKIVIVKVQQSTYFSLPDYINLLQRRLNRKQAKILSPFDNLLIQRKRTQTLFNFDYLLECYVPESKRRFGYFSLPILWDGRLVAQVDCKVDKSSASLIVKNLVVESKLKHNDAFFSALEHELIEFSNFNNCQQHTIRKITTY